MRLNVVAMARALAALNANPEARKATIYVSANEIARATLPFKRSSRARSTTVVLTSGKPAFAERRFIAACKKAGEPLPLARAQLRFWPKPKRKKK